MLHEKRKCRAHQDRRDEQQQKTEKYYRRKIRASRMHGRPLKKAQGKQSESGHAQFGDSENQNRATRKMRGQPAAHETADSESQHEGGDDHGYRLRIHSVNRKKNALPDNLINQGGHS